LKPIAAENNSDVENNIVNDLKNKVNNMFAELDLDPSAGGRDRSGTKMPDNC